METTIREEITCPVCRGQAAHRYSKGLFAIAQCVECSTLFAENPPSDTSNMYDEAYFFGGKDGGGYGSYDEEKESMRSTFEKCLDHISVHKSHGKLFDVGAATGYFLALARNRGFSVSGIDISAAAAKAAEEKGIAVAVGTLETVPYAPSSYDVVTMFDVLEHVAHPDSLLRDVAKLLVPGGVVMGCTPDSRSLAARIMGKYWHLLCPPEHLVLLNEKSLKLLLEKRGLEVLWTGRITKRFSLPYILQTASRWPHLAFLARVGSAVRGRWFARIAIPLDLHDNLFFMARRP